MQLTTSNPAVTKLHIHAKKATGKAGVAYAYRFLRDVKPINAVAEMLVMALPPR